jgi:hypothetical protein
MFRGWEALSAAVEDTHIAASAEAIVEARRLIDRLEAKVAEAEVEYTKSAGYEPEGHATYASFLRGRCGQTTAESNRVAQRAKKLARWPEVLDAWNNDHLTRTQVDLMCAKVPEPHLGRFAAALARGELDVLVGVSTFRTQKALNNWVIRADGFAEYEAAQAGDDDAVDEVPERELSASRIIDDRLETQGSFDKDSGAVITDALLAAERPDTDDERRTPKQRRADALVEMARFYLAHHKSSPGTGRPDRLVVVADIVGLFRSILRGDGVRTPEQLEQFLQSDPHLGALEKGLFCDAFDGHGGTAHTLDGHTVTDELVRHVAQSGLLERLLMVKSRIIDHGRSTRIFTESQKRAMAARDGGSRISGAQPSRCDAHHSPPFERGGTTDVNAGYLKTRREHLDQHRRGFTDRIDPDGTITLISPAGTEHDTRPPNWPTDTPRIAVPTTARAAPDLPFRPAEPETHTGNPSHTSDGTGSAVVVESIDWNAIEPPAEPQHEEGWEPLELGDDEDDPAEITRIDAYIRRRHRRPIERGRTGAA